MLRRMCLYNASEGHLLLVQLIWKLGFHYREIFSNFTANVGIFEDPIFSSCLNSRTYGYWIQSDMWEYSFEAKS